MPAYLLIAAVSAVIPPQFLTQALDDDNDGVADAGLFSQIVANAQTEIDGILGGRFTTPFDNPLPAVVSDAALKIVCEGLYKRRGIEADKNPWAKDAKEIRDRLAKIAKGEMPLYTTLERAKPSASAITDTARTTSKSGRAAI